jgi:hypothetical protein
MSMKQYFMITKGNMKAFSTFWAFKKGDLYEFAEVMI